MNISIIATDLDGTFVTHQNTVSEINHHAVAQAHAKGIPFVFATGRPARWLQVLEGFTQLDLWVIASNGAVTARLSDGQITRSYTMDRTVVREIIRDLRAELPNSLFAVEYLDSWGAEDGYPQRMGDYADITAPVEDLLTHKEIIKLLIRDSKLATEELYAKVNPIIGGRLSATFSFISAQGVLEISAPGVSKASALQDLMADLGVDPAGLVAFGDMPNDQAMLDLADRGYTMAGAHESLISAGFPIAGDCNDSGVGKTVLRLLGLTPEAAPTADPPGWELTTGRGLITIEPAPDPKR